MRTGLKEPRTQSKVERRDGIGRKPDCYHHGHQGHQEMQSCWNLLGALGGLVVKSPSVSRTMDGTHLHRASDRRPVVVSPRWGFGRSGVVALRSWACAALRPRL